MPLLHDKPWDDPGAEYISAAQDALHAQALAEKKLVAYGAIGLAALLVVAFIYRKQIAGFFYWSLIFVTASIVRRSRQAADKVSKDIAEQSKR